MRGGAGRTSSVETHSAPSGILLGPGAGGQKAHALHTDSAHAPGSGECAERLALRVQSCHRVASAAGAGVRLSKG